MVIPFAVLLISLGYLCYQVKDEVYLVQEKYPSEKNDTYKRLDDLFA